jgi:hypothetical protein
MHMDQETLNLSGVASFTTITLAMLITELDKRGAISKADFAKLVRDSAASAEANAPDHRKNQFRMDLFLARRLADHLDDPAPSPTWTPIVIDGDKD